MHLAVGAHSPLGGVQQGCTQVARGRVRQAQQGAQFQQLWHRGLLPFDDNRQAAGVVSRKRQVASETGCWGGERAHLSLRTGGVATVEICGH